MYQPDGMRKKFKLKTERVRKLAVTFVIILLALIALQVAEDEIFGTHYIPWLYGLIILIFGSLFYRAVYMPHPFARIWLLTGYILLGTAVWHYELASHINTFLSDTTYDIHLAVMVFMFLLLIPYMLVQKSRIKTRFRKLFELAAQPVEDTRNGYSTRPYPAGKGAYTRDEIVALGRFLEKHMIAVMHPEDDRILLSFSANLGFNRKDHEKYSNICFNDNGEILVTINRDDYAQFKDTLAFEQLCDSIALLFRDFLEKFRQGREKEILVSMDAMEPGIFKIIVMIVAVLVTAGFIVSIVLWYIARQS